MPFFVALDTTGIDVNTPTGAGIPIEERAAQELRTIAGVQVRLGLVFPFTLFCSHA